ncbi:spore germination protein [Paenibacillus polymyxa]|uniref:spore germination protein n=1 Tax=Paenibacillus polymyxa TaxID=1406 RepID=UPI002378E001|nr:spore germination protein [Paenibacillus polymyxa]WDM19975.1 spore germination protein [Paenibacillus polymyxa]
MWKSSEINTYPLTLDVLKTMLAGISEASIIERCPPSGNPIWIIYLDTLVDEARINESILKPLLTLTDSPVPERILNCKFTEIHTLQDAEQQLMRGAVIVHEPALNQWWTTVLPVTLGRPVGKSETETIIYGPQDSFTEQIDQNITLIRRRLPLSTLKSEQFTAGSLSSTSVSLLYIEGLTNTNLISNTKEKLAALNYDIFLDSGQIGVFIEDHANSLFPQLQQTDRPDQCAYSLAMGKVVILVDNSPFALIGPITFFHLFQSPEDYIHRWIVASFLRLLRFFSFFLSLILIPVYVALTAHHYQMIPLPLLFVLIESRSKLPFTPFWEGLIMLVILEIIKEASLRMPNKTSQTLGVVGGIVIGQAAVEAGFASKVLIVLLGVSGIASFLSPNYQISKANTVIQLTFLCLAAYFGIFGIILGLIVLLAHLNGLTSLREPYLAPLTPLYFKDWKDFVVRVNLHWMETRPSYLKPLKKWRYSRRRR